MPADDPNAHPAAAWLLALLLAAGCGAEDSAANRPDVPGEDVARDSAEVNVDLESAAEVQGDLRIGALGDWGDEASLEERCPPPDDCQTALDWVDGACQFGPVADGTECAGVSDDACVTGFECSDGACLPRLPSCAEHRPVVFVHGINGQSGNFDTMIRRLVDDGWPEAYIFRFDAQDASWGCNVENAAAIDALVHEARARTCQPRVDLVAHSMGSLSSRFFVKNLGGHEAINTYVTLGGMHHGLFTPCLAPDFLGVCVWRELCETGEFIEQLNDDPTTPGDLHWVSIYGTADESVPNESSQLDGAENIVFEGVEHSGENGLLERRDVYEAVRRVLLYPCP